MVDRRHSVEEAISFEKILTCNKRAESRKMSNIYVRLDVIGETR